MFFHIFHYKLISFFKTAFDKRAVSIVRGVASSLVFCGFAYGAYTFAFSATRFMLEHTHTGLYLYHTFISMLLFVLFVAVNLGNIIVSYSTLYRSSEVSFLLTKPVSFTTIFILKFFDNFFYSSTTLFVVAFMVLFGYGSYFGYPWYFFAGVMIFVMIPFMFLSACLAVLILMAIMKLAGRIGFRKVMAGLFSLYFFFIYLFFNSSNPITLVEKLNRFYPNIDEYLSHMVPGFLQYLPNQWVAQFLFYIARGEVMNALPYAGILLSVTIIVFGLCFFVADRFYYRSWLVSLDVQSKAQKFYDPAHRHFLDFRSHSIFPSQIEVLVKKEFFVFFREASQWIHLVVMFILTGLFAISVSNINLKWHIMDVQLLTYLVMFVFGGFMVSSLTLRFVFPMIGLEGQTFWALRSSPIKEGRIFLIKFILGFMLVLPIAEYIAIASNIPFIGKTELHSGLLWFGVFNAFWISLTMVSFNLGFGGFFANYLEQNPIRAASTQGATLTFLATLVYLIVIVVIILVPVSAYFASLFQFKVFHPKILLIAGMLLSVVSLLLSTLGFIAGLRSMRRDF
jgi:ABC-2 type transport system permease protein